MRPLQKLLSYNHELLELILASLKIVWGIWYLLPFDVYARVPSSSNLASVAPEWLVGCVFLALGLSQLFCVTSTKSLLKVRLKLALFSVSLWTLITIMSFFGNRYAPAGPTTMLFAFWNVVIYMKLKAIHNTLAPDGIAK